MLKAQDGLQHDHEGKTSIKVPGINGGSARYDVFTDEGLYRVQGAANDEEEAKAALSNQHRDWLTNTHYRHIFWLTNLKISQEIT
mgnify:CR=1 FL=1